MVLKRFVKSLDFRLQCWVWKKIKLHGTQTLENHECAGLEEDKIAGFSNLLLRCKDKEIAGHSNQRCRRFCFVIIIPYPDRKANICSIRLRAEKGEV